MIDPKHLFELSFLLPILYAETHYRFKYFFSWLKKSEPEIIADIPSRIQKGKQLPVLIIIKDSDKYNTEILDINIYDNDVKIFSQEINTVLDQTYFDKLFFIDTTDLGIGNHDFDVKIKYKFKNKIKTCINDNHRGTKHKPLPIYISEDPLPKFENCFFGETHSHTNYTSDQLEFGASLKSTSVLSESMGLHFFCATDHSYDLDDEENNYLKNDPNLPKWKKFLKEVKEENESNPNFKIIAGEEASLQNSKNKNIHCLIYNSKKFYPGNGDSGEKWLQPFSELTIKDVLNDVDENTLIFAAHPVEPVPLLQKLLIRRDNWHEEDCRNPRLNGLQFANGGPQKYYEQGKKLWIKLLLEGQNLTGLAGNDAHGNFARYRQVNFPFIKIEENYFHLFGVWRTGVYINSGKIETEFILQSIKDGNCFLTNGPALQFQAFSNDKTYLMGSNGEQITRIVIEAISTEEFGMINNISVLQGIIGENSEKVILRENIYDDGFDSKIELNIDEQMGKGYFRCEVETDLGKTALSNPIWYK
jgi:hypothetical protein